MKKDLEIQDFLFVWWKVVFCRLPHASPEKDLFGSISKNAVLCQGRLSGTMKQILGEPVFKQRKDTPENSPLSSVFLRPRLWDVQQFILIPT
ncbi:MULTISPECIES: hypothetical protein [Pseudomonas syringae group genomosp. 2]|uniref:hypothetical protein n=1 Tax=Pseudomonas syringae group genomosp. 2 TaxID=251698 RepID=UPI00051761FF|nr:MULTISPECIES: hypothetical protein [Pseudomonas syringae group genomosp. 2]MCQ3012475.1 hypothetical protein [Pseudomonas savastanoi]